MTFASPKVGASRPHPCPVPRALASSFDLPTELCQGGAAPCDEGSITASAEDAQCMVFIADGSETKALVDNTVTLASLTDLSPFDAIFFAVRTSPLSAKKNRLRTPGRRPVTPRRLRLPAGWLRNHVGLPR